VNRVRDQTLALGTFLVLAVAVCAVYGRTIESPFIFDDLPGIVKNPSIVRLWPPIGDARQRGPLNPPPLAPTARRPLPNLTFALNYRLGGLDPRGYHLVNLALHVLTAAVLAAVVRRTLRLPYFGGGAWERAAGPVSLVVALVWALHPLDTEAVVYVTQRTELLVALFYLTTLWAAIRYWTAGSAPARRGWLATALLASLSGMASKEVMASIPLVVLLYERTFLVDSLRAVRRSWPLHVGLALGLVLLVLLSAGGVGGLSDARNHVPVVVWWMTQTKILLLYLKLALWPWPLAIHYAPAYLRTLNAAWPWMFALLVLTAVALALVWRRPAARLTLAAIVMILAPTLVVPLPKMIAAERRMYLPLAGLVTLAIVGGYRFLASRCPSAGTRLAIAAAAALVLASGFVSTLRLQAYESRVTIWRDTVLHQPDDPMAHYNLGVALIEARRPMEAVPEFEQTLRLDPEHTGALDNLGMVLNDAGRWQEAMRYFERALQIEPGDAVAHNDLGAALITLGRANDALPHLTQALTLQPDAPKSKVHLNLGRALMELGRTHEAVAHLEQAVEGDPADADAHYSLGVGLANVGRLAEAIPQLEAALSTRPDDAEIHDALGSALLRSGRPEQAAGHYRRALALAPDYPEAHNNLGSALLALGRTDEAIEEFERALRLNPDHANARYNLASALLNADRPREAIGQFQHALRLRPDDAQAHFECALAYARTSERPEALAMAQEALTLARAHSEAALADRIGAWLSSYRAETRN
jgi:protein O-mannosyl-transferase